ncbi:hypothetical protein C7M61_004486 [Candidozyma pseudohaemuli]|uniref:Uncharacterized protein n=1 Tax=Candidozyma pseudohaemuli TaxID=418784 RepID=A0A2P7YHK7_9ASCO|nr:hypothetical protein C7M61_004486 [[Candida] pseudohaemulonii]PSK35450.1 hypothetical protein C7M61_004486 [[Candida] pseudohaemulonii]
MGQRDLCARTTAGVIGGLFAASLLTAIGLCLTWYWQIKGSVNGTNICCQEDIDIGQLIGQTLLPNVFFFLSGLALFVSYFNRDSYRHMFVFDAFLKFATGAVCFTLAIYYEEKYDCQNWSLLFTFCHQLAWVFFDMILLARYGTSVLIQDCHEFGVTLARKCRKLGVKCLEFVGLKQKEQEVVEENTVELSNMGSGGLGGGPDGGHNSSGKHDSNVEYDAQNGDPDEGEKSTESCESSGTKVSLSSVSRRSKKNLPEEVPSEEWIELLNLGGKSSDSQN